MIILNFLLLAVRFLMRALPLSWCFLLGEGIGLLTWAILPQYRRLVGRNLRIAFPAKKTGIATQKSDAEIDILIRKSFKTVGANLLCSLKIPAMSEEELHHVFSVEGEEIWETYLCPHATSDSQKGTVVALSHFGNWELTAQITTFIPNRLSGTIYQAIRNKALNRFVNTDRAERGVHTFDRRRDMRAATSFLRKGGILGLLIDQHAGDGGVWMPFFHKLASTSPLAASLAKKTGSDLLFVSISTIGRARWRVKIHPPIPTEEKSVAQVSYELGEILAKEVARSPADWFWFHNRWKLPFPAFLLNHTKRGVYLPPNEPPKKLHPLRLLVRSPNWLGDACMSIPSLKTLKEGRPDLQITILSPTKLLPLWEALPWIDQIIPIPAGHSPWRVAKKIRQVAPSKHEPAFDLALLLPNSWRSALEVFLAGIPRKIGRASSDFFSRRWLLDQQLPPSSKKTATGGWHHQADEYHSIAETLGAPPKEKKKETVSTSPKPLVRKNLKQWQIGLCPGAEYGPAKRWPLHHFAQMVATLSQKDPIDWKLLGVPAEKHLGKTFFQELKKICPQRPPSVKNLIGATSLKELLQLLQQLDLLITNDTGTMHLASLLGIPVIALFGSTEPAATGPQGAYDYILRHPVDCSPCFLRKCPIDFPCMEQLPPQRVIKAFEQFKTNFSSFS